MNDSNNLKPLRHLDEELVEAVLDGVEEKYLIEAAQYSQGKRAFKPVRMVMKAAACLALLVAVPVISLSVATAAGVDSAYDMLYSINPSMALKMRPVNISCEDNGIKMEVEAVSIKKDTAKIYISMQDLTGDRIDGTTDLFDSAGIESKYDCSGMCSLESYDEKEKKATFLVYQKTFDHKKIGGSKVKFSVSRFLSHKKSMEGQLSAIHLGQVPADPQTQKDVEIRGESGVASGQEEMVVNEFLAENGEQKFSPIEGVTVTAYGFVEDKLHIQVDYGDILKTDNHGELYLKDEDGNGIHCSKNVSFWHKDGKGSYEEYVFDVGAEDLEGLSVWGYFVVCDSLTEGDWSVTFPMEER